MIILQKVKFSSEKQINWDRLVSLPESPFASLLLQCKEKAKTCNNQIPTSDRALTSQWEFQAI